MRNVTSRIISNLESRSFDCVVETNTRCYSLMAETPCIIGACVELLGEFIDPLSCWNLQDRFALSGRHPEVLRMPGPRLVNLEYGCSAEIGIMADWKRLAGGTRLSAEQGEPSELANPEPTHWYTQDRPVWPAGKCARIRECRMLGITTYYGSALRGKGGSCCAHQGARVACGRVWVGSVGGQVLEVKRDGDDESWLPLAQLKYELKRRLGGTP